MTHPTDRLEQAKREIAEEQPYGIDAGFLRIGLERERARNLELREALRLAHIFLDSLPPGWLGKTTGDIGALNDFYLKYQRIAEEGLSHERD